MRSPIRLSKRIDNRGVVGGCGSRQMHAVTCHLTLQPHTNTVEYNQQFRDLTRVDFLGIRFASSRLASLAYLSGYSAVNMVNETVRVS